MSYLANSEATQTDSTLVLNITQCCTQFNCMVCAHGWKHEERKPFQQKADKQGKDACSCMYVCKRIQCQLQ